MALVEPLEKARIVAGERGLDRIIQSVNVMEVPDILQWVRPGELLVTTMSPLRDDAAEIDALIPRLAERGPAGLAVTPSGYMPGLPDSMIDAANALGFPLIDLPEKVSFIGRHGLGGLVCDGCDRQAQVELRRPEFGSSAGRKRRPMTRARNRCIAA